MPRYDAAWIEGMVGAAREAASPQAHLLDLAGVAPGDRVADVGCGPGFLTLPAARRVGAGGLIWALDREPAMLRLVAERAAAAGLANIAPLRAAGERLPLRAGVADVAICSLLLHDLAPEERGATARELARLLRPGGCALVVEWQPRPGERRPNRLRPDLVAALLREAGLDPRPARALGAIARPDGPEGLYAVAAHAPA